MVRIFRPDYVLNEIKELIATKMGSQFIVPPEFSLSNSYEQSAPHIPIIFVLSPGVDPLAHLNKLAEENDIKVRLLSTNCILGTFKMLIIRLVSNLLYKAFHSDKVRGPSPFA